MNFKESFSAFIYTNRLLMRRLSLSFQHFQLIHEILLQSESLSSKSVSLFGIGRKLGFDKTCTTNKLQGLYKKKVLYRKDNKLFIHPKCLFTPDDIKRIYSGIEEAWNTSENWREYVEKIDGIIQISKIKP